MIGILRYYVVYQKKERPVMSGRSVWIVYSDLFISKCYPLIENTSFVDKSKHLVLSPENCESSG